MTYTVSNAMLVLDIGPFVSELVGGGVARSTLIASRLSVSLLVVSVTVVTIQIVSFLDMLMLVVRWRA
jgi:hypothetical protein